MDNHRDVADGRTLLLRECEVIPEDLEMSVDRLKEFTEPYLALMPRSETRQHADDFLEGLLADLERKSTEPIAERLGQDRRPLQYFIGASPWEHEGILNHLNQEVAQNLGEPNGVFVIDPSAFPKKGEDSVGVARQWCGRLGKTENCQLGVFLGYVSNRGHTLVDERLYLPKAWSRDKARRNKCHVPKSVRFKTAQTLALDMLRERRAIFPHRWVVADDEFGRGYKFREGLHRMGERYLLECPSNLSVRPVLGRPPRRRPGRERAGKASFVQARIWAKKLSSNAWEKVYVRDTTQGPLNVWAARVRVQTKDKRRCSKRVHWLLVIRTDEKVPEYRYYLSNAEEEVTLQEMGHTASARQWIEDCFERAKGKVGLDHYEVRSWIGWHHHMTLCLLALYFLVLEQRRLNARTPAMTLQQSADAIGELLRNPDIDLHSLAHKITHRLCRNEQSRIDHWKKFNRLPPSWIIARATHVPYYAQ
jgi:SRSO17 transposase